MKNIGIIGPGRIATNCFAPALAKVHGAQLWSVLSRDLSRAKKFAKTHRANSSQPAFDNLDEMLSDPELHGVIITLPDKLHAKYSLAALNAGKHVLVEKPMTTDSESARVLTLAAKKFNLCLAVGYSYRWNAGHRKIKQMIEDDYIGELRHIRVHWSWQAVDGNGWRATPNLGRWWSMGGVGTHCLDLIRWFMIPSCGEIAKIVPLVTTGIWNRPHDETALVNMKFESGATGEFTSSVLFQSPNRIEIYGDAGYISCENTLNWQGTGRITSHDGEIDFQTQNPFEAEVQDFVEVIRTGGNPEVGGVEATRNIEILEEISNLSGVL